jgi:hypothetical protein
MKIAVLLATCTAFLASARQPSLEPPVRVNIRVLNVGHVPKSTLAEARRIVDYILGAAGIQAVWLDCDSPKRPCSGPPLATDLWLQLLRERPHTLEPDTAGYALLVHDCVAGCGYAAVSYPAIQAVAREWGGDPVCLLGATIAHEIGHLLLGAHSHAHEGVMSPRFRREELNQAGRGELLFTAGQAERLKAEIRERSLPGRER